MRDSIDIILKLLEQTQFNLSDIATLSNNFTKQYKQGFLNEEEYSTIKKELARIHNHLVSSDTKFRGRSTINKINYM